MGPTLYLAKLVFKDQNIVEVAREFFNVTLCESTTEELLARSLSEKPEVLLCDLFVGKGVLWSFAPLLSQIKASTRIVVASRVLPKKTWPDFFWLFVTDYIAGATSKEALRFSFGKLRHQVENKRAATNE